MKAYRIIVLLELVSIFFSCDCVRAGGFNIDSSSDRPPDWILGQSALYPSSQYLIGVGLSSTSWGVSVALKRANNNALAAIARIIEARVERTQKLLRQNTSSMGRRIGQNNWIFRTEKSDMSSFVRISTNQIIQGIEFKEKYYNQEERVLYVLAVLDRVVAAERLEREIRELDYQVGLLGEKAGRMEGVQDLMAAVRIYREALGFSLKSDVLKRQQSVIAPHFFREYDSEHSSAQITFRLAELLQRIEIYVLARDVDFIEVSICQVMAEAGFSVKKSVAKSRGLTLQCDLSTVWSTYPALYRKKELHVCRLYLGVMIIDNRTKRIMGQVTLLANSNAEDSALAKERALRLLSKEVKEELLGAFYETLSIKLFE
ncbi:LPP20 family lipoprotein [Patescibacteria group bacterium]|nr:LPP20 family lipoprotein [Patescibacteria group bacterium]